MGGLISSPSDGTGRRLQRSAQIGRCGRMTGASRRWAEAWPSFEPTRRTIMSDATSKGGKTAGATPFELPKVDFTKFELPKFDFGKFDLSKMELPPAFREAADKGAAQLRDAYDKARA